MIGLTAGPRLSWPVIVCAAALLACIHVAHSATLIVLAAERLWNLHRSLVWVHLRVNLGGVLLLRRLPSRRVYSVKVQRDPIDGVGNRLKSGCCVWPAAVLHHRPPLFIPVHDRLGPACGRCAPDLLIYAQTGHQPCHNLPARPSHPSDGVS